MRLSPEVERLPPGARISPTRLVLGLATSALIVVLAYALAGPTAAPGHADVVVVLAGEQERLDYARSLVETGVAPRLLTTLIDPECTRAGRAPEKCGSGVRNTVDEALLMHRVLTAEGVRRATVVTSGYHVLRTAAVFRTAFLGSGIEITVRAPAGSPSPLGTRFREFRKLLPSFFATLVGRLCDCLYTRPAGSPGDTMDAQPL